MMKDFSTSISAGNNGKTKATELTTYDPALSKGVSCQGKLTKEASGDSQSVQTPGQIGSSEMQQGHFQTGRASEQAASY